MAKIIQFRLFEPPEVHEIGPRGYEGFTAKFKPKKTTDDCYTPPAVYDAVVKYIDGNIMKLDGYTILRPFKPGGDYLSERYGDDTVVIDNPPFSIYRRIVRNYYEMGARFFLFGPALSLFVPGVEVAYIIQSAEIVYENGAKVRTSFVTNMLPVWSQIRVILAGKLEAAIIEAQHHNRAKKKHVKPDGLYSSADLLKFVKAGEDRMLEGSTEYVTEINGRRIFGSAMKFPKKDTDYLKTLEYGK